MYRSCDFQASSPDDDDADEKKVGSGDRDADGRPRSGDEDDRRGDL